MKKLLVALAALGLLAALVAPAPAAEIKASGQLRSKHFVTNSVGNQVNPGRGTDKIHGTTTRMSMLLTFIGNEYASIGWNLELDYDWGDTAYDDAARGDGGGLSTDSTNLETKGLYLDVAVPETPLSFRVGAQSWYDPWGGGWGIMDAPGIKAHIDLDDTRINLGYFMLWDDTFDSVVDDVSHWRLDVTHAFSPKFTLDGYFWYLKDGSGHSGGNGFLTNVRPASKGNAIPFTHNAGYVSTADRAAIMPMDTRYDADFFYLGAQGRGAVGPVKYHLVGLYQTGTVDVNSKGVNEPDANAFFLQGRGTIAHSIANGGSFGLHVTYVSGVDSESSKNGPKDLGLITLGNYQLAGAWYYGPGMMLLVPDGDAINAGQSFLAYDINNIWEDQFLGMFMPTASWVVKLPMNLTARVAGGALWSAEERSVNGEQYMGAEINTKLTYQIAPGATIELNGAYAATGDDFYEVSKKQAANASAHLDKDVKHNKSADDLYWFSTVFRVRI